MEFHVNLQKARERSGLTQQQVAQRLGIAKSTYSNYESGKREPDVRKIKELTRILGISGDALLETGVGPEGPLMQREKAPSLSDEALLFAWTYEELDHWGQGAVRAVLQAEKNRCGSLSERYAPHRKQKAPQLEVAASDGSEIPREVVESGIIPQEDVELPK